MHIQSLIFNYFAFSSQDEGAISIAVMFCWDQY